MTKLSGKIDERFDFAPLLAGQGPIFLDFSAVSAINSQGVARFLKFTENWRGRPVSYLGCPAPIVDALMMLPVLLGPEDNLATVVSFQWVVHCAGKCAARTVRLETNAAAKRSKTCPKCAAALDYGELEEFLSYLAVPGSKGELPPELARPFDADSQSLRPSLQTLTVMFIDVAGFSIAAEDRAPAVLFAELKEFVDVMRRIIRKHGGMVDKVLGDGLLCYFGYSNRGEVIPPDRHALAAVTCAFELQQASVASCIKDRATGKALYAIRIGLNTDPVYVGDLGDTRRVEFTVIGHGVNYAKRIQDSCDLFMVMMSASSRAALASVEHIAGSAVTRRGIMIKHHDRLFDVYEMNPFVNDPQPLRAAIKAYQEFHGVERGEPRRMFNVDAPLEVSCDYGRCDIVDVSTSGIQVRLDRYLARDVNLRITITSRESDRKSQYLSLIGLNALNCVVRWGRPGETGAFYHGLRYLNLSEEQKQIVFGLLSQYSTAV